MNKFCIAVLLCLAVTGPASGAAVAPPSPAPPADGLATGRVDYRAKCANCHGANALLTMKTARQLRVDPRKLSLMASKMSRDEMIAITEKGREKMPGFENELSRERIAAVVDYILEFRTKRIRQESLIRTRTPVSPPHPAPVETPEKGPEAAP